MDKCDLSFLIKMDWLVLQIKEKIMIEKKGKIKKEKEFQE